MIEVTPEIERIAAGIKVPPRAPRVYVSKNLAAAIARAQRGKEIKSVVFTPEMFEAVRVIRHWWPGIRNEQHAVEVALRWMAQQSAEGAVTSITL